MKEYQFNMKTYQFDSEKYHTGIKNTIVLNFFLKIVLLFFSIMNLIFLKDYIFCLQ